MSDSLVMADRDTVDAIWAHNHPESAFWWAHEMYNVPVSANISVSPKYCDGFWVYRLMNHEESVFYVGQSENLIARLRTHMAQRYGKDVEYVMATRLNSADEMDMVESTLITGWNPSLNSALTQFSDGTFEKEANRLADSLNWELIWGFGTMFWSTDKLMSHIEKTVDLIDYDSIYELMGESVTKHEFGDMLLSGSDESIVTRLTLGSIVWSPSMRFLFDQKSYDSHLASLGCAFRDSVRDWMQQ